jgi:hypothetical protein
MTAEQARLFRHGRRQGWPKPVCAQYAGLPGLPGSSDGDPFSGSMKGKYFEEIRMAHYLPEAALMLKDMKKFLKLKRQQRRS